MQAPKHMNAIRQKQPDSKNILCGNCLPFPIDQKRSELRIESGKCTVCTDKNQIEEMHFGSKKIKFDENLLRKQTGICTEIFRYARLIRNHAVFPCLSSLNKVS